ncbi:cell division protein ZapD [Sideroxydans sp. CL21]|uniref:cell division protein ZapD n=1 Tax=Sideroxydans sp. CL21 TaxID=2600596 RepID=UPI0024BCD4C0|nr:cell division protein ZapD [Sideroxydans sp. CL21]
MINYEFPLNERVRTMLRLEDLYFRIDRFIESDRSTDHHAALGVLFEILEVASRADLKSELLQELERQKKALNNLHNNPEILEDALDAVLGEIEGASSRLLSMGGKIGQHLRDDEWLMGIKQRACIPGGVCEFDLPSYHYWQHQSPERRRQSLGVWLGPLLPLHDGITILLKLLRENGKVHHFTAFHGSFQQMQGGRVAQMLRISLDPDLPCIPEISANKYALNIRFVEAKYAAKTALYDQDVPFDLTFCSLQ